MTIDFGFEIVREFFRGPLVDELKPEYKKEFILALCGQKEELYVAVEKLLDEIGV